MDPTFSPSHFCLNVPTDFNYSIAHFSPQTSHDANSPIMDILQYFSFPLKVGGTEPNKMATVCLSLIPGSDECLCLIVQEPFQF